MKEKKRLGFKNTTSGLRHSELKDQIRIKQHSARLYFIGCLFILIWSILLWRMVDLTILDRKFLRGQGDARSLRTLDMPAYRGMITDREGVPLAVSTPVQSLWVNPKIFHPNAMQWQTLAQALNLPLKELQKRVVNAATREFVYLHRQLPPAMAQKIEALKIPGVNFQQEFKRYYPAGDSVAQLIGFTNVDDQGIEGLELAYQGWLEGVGGKKRVVKDRLGRIIEELGILKEPRPGNDLRLSIDNRIQYFAYYELQKTVEKFGAKAGSVVVLDTTTGEVLAVANVPSFNPNVRGQYELNRYRNKAMIDTFEPGSVIKPFSIASALESGQITPKTIIDTRPSWMYIKNHMIRDIHNYGILDVTGVLQHSSNVGVSKMILMSPPEQLIGLLMRSGFAQRSESGYPGESDGSIVKAADANPFVLATLGFGYGLSTTALQLARSYSIFATHGNLVPVRLISYDEEMKSTPVIQSKTADDVLAMMEAVLAAEGTGKLANVPGYRVAGKTGTARIAGKKGYKEHRHIASFVGIAPVTHPRLIVAVIIHEPTKISYYGGGVAAPLFAKVMGTALRILEIPPDQA